jgi:RNA polymerase sigma-70 factor (ECF subfamily)
MQTHYPVFIITLGGHSFQSSFLDRLVMIAFHRLGRMEDAEDVIQNVFVKAYADREKLRNVRRVGPYLYRMVANACNEHRRKRRYLSLEETETESYLDGQGDVYDQISAAIELQRIEQYLLHLPRQQAEVIRLRVLDGFSLPEIAELTGYNLPTVKSRLRYGLKKLRQIVPFTREESE